MIRASARQSYNLISFWNLCLHSIFSLSTRRLFLKISSTSEDKKFLHFSIRKAEKVFFSFARGCGKRPCVHFPIAARKGKRRNFSQHQFRWKLRAKKKTWKIIFFASFLVESVSFCLIIVRFRRSLLKPFPRIDRSVDQRDFIVDWLKASRKRNGDKWIQKDCRK